MRQGRPRQTGALRMRGTGGRHTMQDVARAPDAPLPRTESTAWWAAMPLDLWGVVLAVIAAGALKLAGILP
ncbi:hypothetical protein Maq22A_c28410 [Methylobacterium aquaticum]|uniref:Uncharacterized protein n=2 Tax=Methylobacterium TaxID=407 RepID=A0A1Y0Z8U8_9HYPH|nr:hypothetical protein Maq22A_c28410 [Methylobacterium aquaticum]